MAKAFIINDYVVGDNHYTVKVFPFPEHGEVDFEVFTLGENDYLFTITSDAPEYSTSILYRYMMGFDRDHVTYSSED